MKSFTKVVCGVSLCVGMVHGRALPELEARDVDCQNPSKGLDVSCWQTLGLTKYVTDFAAANGPKCPSKSFARCFLDSISLSTMNCDTILNNACTPPSPTGIKKPEDFYVAYAIYAINQAFNTYYNAINAANTLASESVAQIVQTLDPPKQTNVVLADVLTALSTALSFLSADNPIIGAMLNGASQATGIAKFLFPTGTANSQNAQIGSLDQSLGDIVKQLLSNVDSAMPLILADANTFLGFAGTGQFSQLTQDSLFQDTSKMLTGLNTYVVSQALQANNIVVNRGPQGQDVNAMVQEGDNQDYKIDGCGNGYDPQGICDTWYFDPDTKISYSFTKLDDWSHNYHDEMESLFPKYTTPKLLMTNAGACADAGNSQKPGQLISAVPGGLNSVCLSNPKVCDWNQDEGSSVETLFSNCDNPGGWAGDACTGVDGGVKVPAGYIGPLWSAGDGACR